MKSVKIVIVGAVVMALAGSEPASPAERGMFGGSPSRNMVSDAKGLPDDWDVESGRNVPLAVGTRINFGKKEGEIRV